MPPLLIIQASNCISEKILHRGGATCEERRISIIRLKSDDFSLEQQNIFNQSFTDMISALFWVTSRNIMIRRSTLSLCEVALLICWLIGPQTVKTKATKGFTTSLDGDGDRKTPLTEDPAWRVVFFFKQSSCQTWLLSGNSLLTTFEAKTSNWNLLTE